LNQGMNNSSATRRIFSPANLGIGRCGVSFSLFSVAAAALCLVGCTTLSPSRQPRNDPPAAPREFRAAWVAAVANIDWPSQPGLPVATQQAEILAILDRASALKLNAIVLQVRPAADALYPSALEPWSEYLCGEQGRAPVPFYDPLQMWIEEAHRRGLELHAWFNPYRARHHQAKSAFAPNHLALTHPAAVKKYGESWWLDPGEPIAVQRTLAVIADVVRRYDVDGVHLDDYFYPYPIAPPAGAIVKPGEIKESLDFPDEPSWKIYRTTGGQLKRADWRRQNVNSLVEQLHRTVHAIKPTVKFGLSPFGLGRPDRRPPGIAGFSQYDQLYADVEHWIERGWMDYLTPQLYWPAAATAQSFPVLLDYWAQQINGRFHLWPGLFTSRINATPQSWSVGEITQQIAGARAQSVTSGHVHFSMVALLQDRHGISTLLQTAAYAQAALVPTSPWLDAVAPRAPKLKALSAGKIMITPAAGKPVANYAIWREREKAWEFSIQPASAPLVEARGAEALVVSSIDRLGNESARVTLRLNRPRL
jgi:uncharacterized lipoprotein YddW (UPF0748 family)